MGKSEKQFGTLQADGPRPANGYSLTTNTGWRMRFRGDPSGNSMNITGKHGRLLSIIKANGTERRSVHIGSSADVGLIVLCVLAVDILVQVHAQVMDDDFDRVAGRIRP